MSPLASCPNPAIRGPNIEAYQNAVYEVEYKELRGASPEHELPPAAETAFARLTGRRVSCRAFAAKSLSRALLSTVLAVSYGISRRERIMPADLLTLLRPVPSAGGLFPLEIYLITQRIEGLQDGLYHNNVCHHSLETLASTPQFERFRPALFMYESVKDANVLLFLSAVFKRTQKKYGARGYRYILLEAGHVGQNLCLLAVEANLGTLCMGGYSDAQLCRLLNLNPHDEGVAYSIALGWPAPV